MSTPSSPDRDDVAEKWSAAQVAAVASAEAIAARAAAEVASEAADAAREAVEVARAVAARAAARASDVAAKAVLAVAAAAAESVSGTPGPSPSGEDSSPAATAGADDTALINTRVAAAAGAADKVALCVAAVATAAAEAVVEASALIGEQLAADVAAAAAAVSVAAAITHPHPAGGPRRTEHLDVRAQPVELRGGLGMAEELRQGIAANEMRLHYQPIIDLATGRPVGVEALVRWQHPVRGLLGPEAFMDVAERTDVVLSLGAWVLHEACRFGLSQQTWGGEALTVAVNLSGRQLSDRGLVATVRACLEAQCCAADRLVFEVTETALVTDMGVAVASLQALQAMGAGVAIDDFGTGYCSLLYLKHLSANDLKIDRSFVSGLGVDSHSTAIVASLISLAHNLGLRCVAEGVETTTQLDLLEQLGCDLAQGYLFCPPVAVPALQAWLDRQPTAGVQHRRLVARIPEAPRILAMHNNSLSVHSIAAALNAEGKRTPGGVRWSAQSVSQIVAQGRA